MSNYRLARRILISASIMLVLGWSVAATIGYAHIFRHEEQGQPVMQMQVRRAVKEIARNQLAIKKLDSMVAVTSWDAYIKERKRLRANSDFAMKELRQLASDSK